MGREGNTRKAYILLFLYNVRQVGTLLYDGYLIKHYIRVTAHNLQFYIRPNNPKFRDLNQPDKH